MDQTYPQPDRGLWPIAPQPPGSGAEALRRSVGRSGHGGSAHGRSEKPFRAFPDWWPVWEGETVAIVAGGPSAKSAEVELTRNRCRVIAINESWRLTPWAEILYGCDHAWWKRRAGVPEFTGLKLGAERALQREPWGVRRVIVNRDGDALALGQPGRVGWSGNSGFHCVNLAVQMRVAQILLIGFDMRVDRGLHWHGPHPRGLNNPNAGNVARWRACLDAVAERIAAMGVEVINCSEVSALEAYPKRSLREALAC